MEISRMSYRYWPVEQPENDLLRAKLHEIVQKGSTAGYRTAWAYLLGRGEWQNVYGESFHTTLRRECLSRELFHTLVEARVKTERWQIRYNEWCPHSSLGYLTPVEFRDEVWIPLLEWGRPSTHQDSKRHNGD